jgi:pilus assembly protein Flp/PilA
MLQKLKRLLRDEEAPTAIEYAIMLSGIALLIISAVWLLGNKLNNAFNAAAQHVPGGGTPP